MSTQQPFSNSDLFIQICFPFYSCHPGLDTHYPASVSDHCTSLPPPDSTLLTQGRKPTMSLHCLLKYEIFYMFFRVFLSIRRPLSNSMFHCPQDILQLQQNLKNLLLLEKAPTLSTFRHVFFCREVLHPTALPQYEFKVHFN